MVNEQDSEAGWAIATIGKGTGVVRVWPISALAGPAAATGERQVHRAVTAGDQAVLVRCRELTLVNTCKGPPATAHLELIPEDVAALEGANSRIVVATRDQLWCWPTAGSPMRQWSAQTPAQTAVRTSWPHPTPLKHVSALTVCGEDYVFTLDSRGALRRWDLPAGRPENESVKTGVVRPAGMVAYHDGDGVVVAIGGDAVVRRWRLWPGGDPAWAPLDPVTCEKLPKALTALSRRDADPAVLFVVTEAQIVRVTSSGEHRWPLPVPAQSRAATAWRSDAGDVRLAVADGDGRIRLFDGVKGELLHVIPTGLDIKSVAAAVRGGHRSLVVGAQEGAVAIDLAGQLAGRTRAADRAEDVAASPADVADAVGARL